MTDRTVRSLFPGKPTIEGAGVHLHRIFGFDQEPLLDPFLMLDDFSGSKPGDYEAGFPWHPHRGIETITYVLRGEVEHGDSLGNSGVIHGGDVQWMTAGSGIIHQEMPHGDGQGVMSGFQLWSNLPRSHKMMDPRYRDVASATIPVLRLENGTVLRAISGCVGDTYGPVRDIVSDPTYLDVTLPAGVSFERAEEQGRTVFAYVFAGQVRAGEVTVPRGTGALVTAGDHVRLDAGAAGARLLWISGRPLGEPVAWGGPIVMNTQEELQVAFEEYRRGTFIKHGAPQGRQAAG